MLFRTIVTLCFDNHVNNVNGFGRRKSEVLHRAITMFIDIIIVEKMFTLSITYKCNVFYCYGSYFGDIACDIMASKLNHKGFLAQYLYSSLQLLIFITRIETKHEQIEITFGCIYYMHQFDKNWNKTFSFSLLVSQNIA
jgi:hypothetical protein